jgi:hypothetical protein
MPRPEKLQAQKIRQNGESFLNAALTTRQTIRTLTVFRQSESHYRMAQTIQTDQNNANAQLSEVFGRAVRRFRPNIVLQVNNDEKNFYENRWIGKELRFGNDLVVRVTDACARCVMITLPQDDLPQYPRILRTARNTTKSSVVKPPDRTALTQLCGRSRARSASPPRFIAEMP